MKFRKKPVVIEAIQFHNSKEGFADALRFVPNALIWGAHLSIKTLEGHMMVNDQDWIIKGIAGEFYPCKPDIFDATYQVEE